MKYEYTHGNESEFNGAPGWAKLAISDGYSNAFCNELDYMATAVWSNGRQFKIANPTKFTIVGVRNLISKESAWNGEGLPPVGCECEVLDEYDNNVWHKCKILAHTFRKGMDVAVFESEPSVSVCSERYFRPIHSEADKKRDAFVNLLHSEDSPLGRNRLFRETAEAIYDAIAAGKIPGVRLEDKM